jgi:hypothetical protein
MIIIEACTEEEACAHILDALSGLSVTMYEEAMGSIARNRVTAEEWIHLDQRMGVAIQRVIDDS